MKRYLIVFVFVMGALAAHGREVFNINRNWKFFSDVELNSDMAVEVNLPHIWNSDALSGKRDYFRGTGNYIKTIDVPAEWSRKRVFIRVNGANSVANVTVNGRHVGEHRGGYTAFTFEITNFLRFGEKNDLWIIVNNSPRLDILPTAGDVNSYGGLFRDVELIVTGDVAVSPLVHGSQGVRIVQQTVNKENVGGSAVVSLIAAKDKTVQVQLSVSTPDNDTIVREMSRIKVTAKNTTTLTIPFSVQSPTLWNGEKNPFMYNIGVKVVDEGTVADAVSLQIGFRTVAIDKQWGLLLNGEPYSVRGVVVHQDRAQLGTAILHYQVIEDFELMREMGANAVRIAGVPHNPDFYDLCDQAGILVWSDIPLIGPAYLTDKAYVNMPSYKENARQQAQEIVSQQWNHPSVVMWGIFSEMNMKGDNPRDFIAELNTIVKKEDPSRLTVATSSQDGEINFITDLIVWNHHFGWGEGTPADFKIWLEQLKANWGHLRSGVSYSAGASIFHQDGSAQRSVARSNWHPEKWHTCFHEEYLRNTPDPFLWGTFVGNLFDYGSVGYNWGESNGINDHGLVTFDRKYRKDAFYLYKANWNKTHPFVHIAEKRWYDRRRKSQTIKVFTNCKEAELFVNGESKGVKAASEGRIVWENVPLRDGENSIDVRYQQLSDWSVICIGDSVGGIRTNQIN